jgi:septum formation protein
MKKKMPMTSSEIILASKSPRRAELLKQHGVFFMVYASDVEELKTHEIPALLPEINAELKCAAAAEIHPDRIVIGADTVILFENTILGKPSSEEDAVRMFKTLSGRKHQVITGCAVICLNKKFHHTFSVVSEVIFKSLTEKQIRDYISKVNVLDKAGAYAIQEHGDDIIESFSGSFDNIIGLPVDELSAVLAGIQ